MATASVARAAHATLSTTTVDTVNLSDKLNRINVINRSGSADLTITWATGGTAAATPVALANETLLIPAGLSLTFTVGGAGYYSTQLKVLGNGNAYSVQGLG